MAQRAEHPYHTDDNYTYGRQGSSNNWIWGVIGAVALLALIVWAASSGGPQSTSIGSTTPTAPAATDTTTGSTDAAPATIPAAKPEQPAQ
jgi:hypothetical protein